MIYFFFRTVIFLMSCIPLPIGRLLGKILGTAVSMIPIQRNRISLDNIRNSLGIHMEKSEIIKLNRRMTVHFGQMLFELPHIIRLNHANLRDYVVFEGEDNLVKALEKGKGVFILTGHFGNWEFASVAISLRFGPIAAVIRPLRSPSLNRLINELRTQFGTEIIPKLNALKKILSALKKNMMVGILLDQNVDWYQGVFVNFLGRWACVNKGLALMALRTEAPVIPIFPVRHADGRYHIAIGEEVRLIRTGDKTTDVEENTALFTGIIEKQVREHPDQWFWFHRRWKTRPYCELPGDK
ncbi:lysophospholipid acyltransferase family protein [Deltaproteobacteria bacterium]|nr:lysophospholipid acyltransferase family protein [Deltaproteobacteria bacterium]